MGLSLLFTATDGGGEGLTALAGTFVYWVAHIGLGLTVLAGVTRLALTVGFFARLAVRTQLVVAGIVGAVAFTPLALVLEGLMAALGGPWPAAGVDTESAALGSSAMGFGPLVMVAGREFGSLVVPFVGSWLLINLSCLFSDPASRSHGAKTVADVAVSSQPIDPAAAIGGSDGAREGLLGRLKPALGRDVLALKAELNYLHVFTTAGQSMVVYSLSRAAAELDGRGIQVHRSWWVARHAVGHVRRAGNGVRCVLVNGLEVPVSRRRQKALLDEFGADFRRDAVA